MTTILAGCGGGYDVFGVIPLYMELKSKSKCSNILITSLSFTEKSLLENQKKGVTKITNNLYKVNASQIGNTMFEYFPEYYLSRHIDCDVYCILVNSTVGEIKSAYVSLIDNKKLNSFYLMDGGCDVLLSGRETELATPVEDMMHLKAVMDLQCYKKYVCAIGMPCDIGHGVILTELEARLKELNPMLLETKVWNLDDEYVKKYYNSVKSSRPYCSIVQSLVCARLEGHKGFYTPDHLKKRIGESVVELNDLVVTFVKYEMNKLSDTILYLNGVEDSFTRDSMDDYITKFQEQIEKN